MLQGSLDNFSLSEVLGLLAGTEKTGRLRVSGDRGTGSLWLEDGQLIAGSGPNEQSGAQDVVFEIMRFRSGNFSFAVDEVPEEAELPQLVDIVVATADDQLVEWQQIESVVPSLDHILTPQPELEDEQITITRDQWRMLIAVGPRSAVREVCNDLGLGEVDGSRMMKVMIEQGLLDIAEDARGRSADAEPTPLVAEAPASEAPTAKAEIADASEVDADVAQAPVAVTPVVEVPVAEAPATAEVVPVAEAPAADDPFAQAVPEPAAGDLDAMFAVGEVTAEMPPVVDTPVAETPISEPIDEPAASLPPVFAAPAPTPIPEPVASVEMPPPPTGSETGAHTPESLAQSLVDSMADGEEPGYTAPIAQDSVSEQGSVSELDAAPSLTDMFASPVAAPTAEVAPVAAHADSLVDEVSAADLPAAPDPSDLIEHASFEDASAFLSGDVPPPPPAPRAERTEGMIPPPPAPTESDMSNLVGSDLDDVMPPPPGADTPPSPGGFGSMHDSVSDSSDFDSFDADSFSPESLISADVGDPLSPDVADMFTGDDSFAADFGDLDTEVAPAALGGMLEDEHETEEKGSSLLMRYLKSER